MNSTLILNPCLTVGVHYNEVLRARTLSFLHPTTHKPFILITDLDQKSTWSEDEQSLYLESINELLDYYGTAKDLGIIVIEYDKTPHGEIESLHSGLIGTTFTLLVNSVYAAEVAWMNQISVLPHTPHHQFIGFTYLK